MKTKTKGSNPFLEALKKAELEDLIKKIFIQKDIAEEAIELNRKIYEQGGKDIDEYLKILGDWRCIINNLRLDYDKYSEKLKQNETKK